MLMLADGRSYWEIQERLQTTAPTISRWKKRFLNDGVSGLLELQHPGQKPSVITPKLQARVLEATRRKPKDGSTHWSVRKLARELNISKDAVHRIWRTAGVKPHRLERYMQTFRLSTLTGDDRPFVLSTPRLPNDGDLELPISRPHRTPPRAGVDPNTGQ